jgi:hypothetical protein
MYLHKGVSCNPFQQGTQHSKFSRNTMELETQLSRCRPENTTKGFNAVGKIRWSGKLDGEGRKQAGLHDDLAVTFCLCIYWTERILKTRYPTVDYERIGIPAPLGQ